MPVTPPAPQPAPENTPATGGLLAVADRPPTDDRWVAGGVGVEPESCSPAQVLGYDCASSPEKEFPAAPAPVIVTPFLVVGADRCSTMSRRSTSERATRHLRWAEGEAIERVLWTGEADGEPVGGRPRPYLASPDVNVLGGGVATDLVHALALLDQAVTETTLGGRGMLHLTPYSLARAKVAGFLERNATGTGWISPNGHVVPAAAAGYTGGGPRPAPVDDEPQPLPEPPDLLADTPEAQWAYGTAMVRVMLDDVVTPSPNMVDVSVNTTTTIAERAAATYFTCEHFGVLLDLALT